MRKIRKDRVLWWPISWNHRCPSSFELLEVFPYIFFLQIFSLFLVVICTAVTFFMPRLADFLHQLEATLPWLGQSSGLLICSKQPILSEKHHIFQQRRKVTAKGWLEVEAKTSAWTKRNPKRVGVIKRQNCKTVVESTRKLNKKILWKHVQAVFRCSKHFSAVLFASKL